jgi:hypothetical protein
MNKYITDFQQTGISTINVDLVCKHWDERFSICTWVNDKEEKYTFVVNGKRKNTRLCKTQISKEQAIEVAEKLKLIHVKHSTFRSAGTYHSESFIKSEIERLGEIMEQKEAELKMISNVFYKYKKALKEFKNLIKQQ